MVQITSVTVGITPVLVGITPRSELPRATLLCFTTMYQVSSISVLCFYNSLFQYFVDCSKVSSLPDLVFVLNGQKFSVPPESYIIQEVRGGGLMS